MPAKDLIRSQAKFIWYNVVTVHSKYQSCGMLLANFQLTRNAIEFRPNKPTYRGKPVSYLFFA